MQGGCQVSNPLNDRKNERCERKKPIFSSIETGTREKTKKLFSGALKWKNAKK
jgi:hypothetical protein